MRMQGLSLETIPPIHIPFRFFLTAPWMGVIAALVLLFGGDRAFDSQWGPELLGITHLLTLGFMAMVMLGAMFQLVPVISGRLIPGGTAVAGPVHGFLLVGCLLLVAGFSGQAYHLFYWAVPLLLLAFAVFLLAVGALLVRQVGGGDSIFCIRFAVMALLISVALGLLRASNYAGLSATLELPDIANIHLAWGLGGWVLLLVMGASYQVIPMFHVTPSYPTPLARGLPVAVFLSLLIFTFGDQPLSQTLAIICISGAATIYAIFSLYLLHKRKRKVADITARFWRLSLSCLVLAALLSVFNLGFQTPLLIGVLMIYGFAISVIMGMLQKIVPFLSYLHLQRRCLDNFELLKTLPHMGHFIPASRLRWQFRLHVVALLLLLLTTINNHFAELAALLMAADFGWLGFTLTRAVVLYRRTVVRISSP
jgi:hypothetical protein